MTDTANLKQDAHRFLVRLEAHLNSTIPTPAVVQAELAEAVAKARAAARGTAERRGTFAEGAFLNSYVLKGLHAFLMADLGLSSEAAKRAVLSESYRGQQFASGSPVRPGAHPFRKVIGVSARQIVEIWKTDEKPLARNSCPDLALRVPSPYRVVFEAKYHAKQSQTTAEAELAKNIYQAFFYLALPRLTATRRHAAWDYEFACVLAYDATPDGHLLRAWRSLSGSVRVACWAGANVYVMILRGSSDAIV